MLSLTQEARFLNVTSASPRLNRDVTPDSISHVTLVRRTCLRVRAIRFTSVRILSGSTRHKKRFKLHGKIIDAMDLKWWRSHMWSEPCRRDFSKFSSSTLHQYLTSNSYIWSWLFLSKYAEIYPFMFPSFYRSLKQIVSEWTLFMSYAFYDEPNVSLESDYWARKLTPAVVLILEGTCGANLVPIVVLPLLCSSISRLDEYLSGYRR